jgi:hypothetical protein
MQRTKILAVLDKYPACSSETIGFCGQLELEIIVSSELRPQCHRSYKIPENLKLEVDQQLQELLKLGFITVKDDKQDTCKTANIKISVR